MAKKRGRGAQQEKGPAPQAKKEQQGGQSKKAKKAQQVASELEAKKVDAKVKADADSSEDESSDGEMLDVGDDLATLGNGASKKGAPVKRVASKATASKVNRTGGGGDDNGDDDDDDDDDSEADEYEKILMEKGENKKMLNVDFEFCDPKEDDFAMIKALITQGTAGLVPNIGLELGTLAGDITEQAAVGTTICVDSEVYGFASALASKHYTKQAYFAALKEWILAACPAQRKTELTEAFEKKGLAWIVSERLVNMPGQLAPPLLRMLCEDVEWARANVAETGGSKDMFDFAYALFLAPCFMGAMKTQAEKDLDESSSSEDEDDDDDDDDDDEGNGQKESTEANASAKSPKNKQAAKGKAPKASKDLVPERDEAPLYLHYEDEDLVKMAEMTFPIKLATKVVLEGKAKGAVPQKHRPRHAQVVLIKLPTLRKVVAQLEKEAL
ncbi:Protein bcp1 [Hondaea fermentalgiana]|uniref:Protein bcp1 n=1 Tax=Hondaea fermentalgiana TaxID=2315210 RepID=A0A2R5GQI1_9STRA|nr:Protein bcp1 [Hondaea fermentalgiana]|eukprot:GBG32028.1 Protein bcp1 [Hondaea fermentalgiana]